MFIVYLRISSLIQYCLTIGLTSQSINKYFKAITLYNHKSYSKVACLICV